MDIFSCFIDVFVFCNSNVTWDPDEFFREVFQKQVSNDCRV